MDKASTASTGASARYCTAVTTTNATLRGRTCDDVISNASDNATSCTGDTNDTGSIT